MANEIFIDPVTMQEEIDSYRSSHEALSGKNYTLTTKPSQPSSVTKYLDCVDQMNQVLTSFTELSENEAKSLEFMRAELLNMDQNLANQTLMERIF